jgi:hypothetical protein
MNLNNYFNPKTIAVIGTIRKVVKRMPNTIV